MGIGTILMLLGILILIFNLSLIHILVYPIAFLASALSFYIFSFNFIDSSPQDADFYIRNCLVYIGVVIGILILILNYKLKYIGLFWVGMLSGIQLSVNLTRLDLLMGNVAHSVVALTLGLTFGMLVLLSPYNLALVLVTYSGSDLLLVGVDLIIRKEYNQFNEYGWVRSYTSPSKSLYVLTILCFLMAFVFSLIHFYLNKYFRMENIEELESYSPFVKPKKSVDLDTVISARGSVVFNNSSVLSITIDQIDEEDRLPNHWSKGLAKSCDYEYYLNKYHQEKVSIY
ncbi:hypothetical protein CONCODRAFT_83178 [Conidiobolus coronatus NRRL 28638]|uniref:TM7S3/TM198-like domain-containing protein n=1 Tax=Conidiobolus coronatus (strain ATCC 28846 / CBS 209.66 / NRRL 28638) TaxID=796925 RepID=A0A137PGD7_CONC2|nr:hypothetical protein CONCODRAFT_83178 [Conidiobolus coronatus NRRL 28638]|eukprot:KXN74066.1 hypothetical protein CONCODRAFT_83178 [Conidiobolus coronatus NRRL 28638]